MAKRRAGNYLTDRNWEEEDEQEESGTFETAGSKVMAKRVIKRAKRRVVAGEMEDAQQDDAVKPSPFAGFAFGANKPSAAFSFKAQTPATFSLKSSPSDKPSATGTAIPTTVPSGIFGGAKASPSASNTNGTNGSNQLGLPTASTSNEEYEKKLQNLNTSVSSWIQKHVNENPICDLTPVFEDYKKHLADIEKLRKTAAANQSDPNPSSTSTASSFSFGKSSDAKEGSTSPKVDFSFKASTAPSTSTATSTFSFGSSTAASSFGSAGKTGAAGSLFGSAQPFTFGTMKSSDSTESDKSQVSKPQGNDDDYEPPKVEVSTVNEKDSYFSKRCKLFYKKGDAYKDRGVGMLHLKKPGKSLQLLVRADTNLGNILLNVTIPSALPVSRQGKNNIIVMTPINPPVERTCPKCNKKYPSPQESNVCDSGCTPEATALLIRVKSGEEADELLSEINKLKDA